MDFCLCSDDLAHGTVERIGRRTSDENVKAVPTGQNERLCWSRSVGLRGDRRSSQIVVSGDPGQDLVPPAVELWLPLRSKRP